VNPTTGVVTGVDAGNAVITYTVTNASGCTNSSSTIVTINPLPQVQSITGLTTICAGSTIILASATNGGTWSSSDPAIATVNSATGEVTGIAGGVVTINYTVTNVNLCSSTVSASVLVNTLPVLPVITANGSTLICPNTTVDLSVPAVYSSYSWNNGMTTPTITVGTPGSYFVTVTNAAGCSSVSAPISISVGDTINPTIAAPADITLNLTSGCSVSGINLGQATTTDNCTVITVTNNAPFNFGYGTTEVTWTVYDAFGNSSTATQLVTIVDTIVPQITAPVDVTVSSNINCEASGIFIGTATGTDNCGFVITNNAPSVFPLGTTTVTWQITDNGGNTSTANQTVTVVDIEIPYVNVVDATLSLGLNGEVELTFEDIDINSSDNCGIDTVIFSKSLFTCPDLGVNPVFVTLIDNSGNSTIESVNITIRGSGIDEDFDGIDDACDSSIDTLAIVIPSGYSPNGDGFNDFFEILGIDSYIVKDLKVYDRYGLLVFEDANYNNTWNGNYLNTNTPLPDATYYYVLLLDNNRVEVGYVYINRVK
jgi:gliding motility-associated-like protein